MTLRLRHPAELLDLIGHDLGTTVPHEITQEQVDRFAEATGDHQWIHTDPVRASRGPFGGTIAHGYLTVSLIPVILEEVLAVDNCSAMLNYGLNRVRFPAPVPTGSKLRATVRVAGARHKPAGLEAVFEINCEIDGGTRPVCIAEMVVLYT